jgi:inosine/xanthosine triphosphate pyrophosphatase family protein
LNIAIIGSRSFSNVKYLEESMQSVINKENKGSFENIIIISGGAKGADRLGKEYAEKYKLGYKEYKAEWKDLSHPDAKIRTNQYGKYDAAAGHRRNTLIINDSDIVVAFHNGSPGTADSLRKAKEMNKIIYEFKF